MAAAQETFSELKAQCLSLCSVIHTDVNEDVLKVSTEVFTKGQGFSTKATVRGRRVVLIERN